MESVRVCGRFACACKCVLREFVLCESCACVCVCVRARVRACCVAFFVSECGLCCPVCARDS